MFGHGAAALEATLSRPGSADGDRNMRSGGVTSIDQALSCGAADCGLDHGALVRDAGMDLILCPTCRILRIPPEKLLHSHVLPDPVGKLSLVMQLLMTLRMHWLGGELPQLKDKHVRIADIGCGDGQFLEFLKSRGYDRICGIEPDEARAGNARRRGIPVFSTRNESAGAGPVQDGVDVMFVWQVLEHIDRPADFIKTYASWLAPSGVLVISVPNQASLQTRLFGYFSAYPDYGRHIWYHKSDYLDWFVRNAPGLKPALMRDRNYEYEVFSWVDSIASAVTRQQNFVHKAVKKGQGSMARRLCAMGAALGLLPIAAVLAPLSLHFRRGSTLTFVLRRLPE
jgi:SAM-dependent methyltransferase